MLCLDQAVYKFIDVKLSKDGRIISVDVSNAFGLGRQKVSSVVNKYRTDYPKNMHHAFHQKCYCAEMILKPTYSLPTRQKNTSMQ